MTFFFLAGNLRKASHCVVITVTVTRHCAKIPYRMNMIFSFNASQRTIRLCLDIKKVMKRVGGMRSCLVSNNSLLKSRDCGWILVALEMAPYIKSAFAFELLTKEQ